jgi:hypothetical protein
MLVMVRRAVVIAQENLPPQRVGDPPAGPPAAECEVMRDLVAVAVAMKDLVVGRDVLGKSKTSPLISWTCWLVTQYRILVPSSA